MTELFLLGAGASVEAGIPDAFRMTKVMLDKFSNDIYSRRINKILQFVVGGLLFQQGIKGENPYGGVNIEDLFNTVLLLGERQNSELGPFISSWHPQLIGLEGGELTGFTGRKLLETIYEPIERFLGGKYRTSSGMNRIDTFHSSSRFESSFTEAVRQIESGGEGRLFEAAADAMISKLVEMVWIIDPSIVEYLIPLVKYAKDQNSAITTLNYDNTIELTGHVSGIEIDTGFEAWSATGDFPLLKLHGSIDWALSHGQTSKEKPLPYQIIQQVDPNANQKRDIRPAIVFGGKNKLTAKGPFLSLLRAFENNLSKSEILTVIGYSFRDEHVNEFIANWFNGNPARLIRIINPDPKSIEREFTPYLFSGRGGDRVNVIAEKAAQGISELLRAK